MKSTWKNGNLVATSLLGTAIVFAVGGLLMAQKGEDSHSGVAAKQTKMTAADIKFAREAAMGGMMEVELGKVAVEKASSDKVKQFGQRMIDDHSKAGDQLKSIAAKDNIDIPSELDAKHKAMVDKYSSMSGAAFDRGYMADMVKDHQMDAGDFQKEAGSGANFDLKNWAGSTLPTLQEHLRIARDTERSLGATSSK